MKNSANSKRNFYVSNMYYKFSKVSCINNILHAISVKLTFEHLFFTFLAREVVSTHYCCELCMCVCVCVCVNLCVCKFACVCACVCV